MKAYISFIIIYNAAASIAYIAYISSIMDDSALEQKIITWRQIQEESRKLIQLDDGPLNMDNIKYIGAMDIGYINSDPDSTIWQGYCTLTLSHFPSMLPYFQQSRLVTIEEPYVSGFLAFREASVYIKMYRDFLRIYHDEKDIPPADVLLIDGAGTYHVRECGSACMVGLGLNIPTIGISKSPVLFEGVADIQVRCDRFWETTQHSVPMPIYENDNPNGIFYGHALRGTSWRPHYVSPGHMISHDLAVTIVQKTRANPDFDPIKLSDKGGRVLVGQVR